MNERGWEGEERIFETRQKNITNKFILFSCKNLYFCSQIHNTIFCFAENIERKKKVYTKTKRAEMTNYYTSSITNHHKLQ